MDESGGDKVRGNEMWSGMVGRFAIDKKIQVGMGEIIRDVGKGDIDKKSSETGEN